MRLQLGENARPSPPSIAENAGNRDLGVVIILWPPPLCGAPRTARCFPVVVIFDAAHRATEVTRTSTMIYAKVQVDALREVALGDGEDLQ